MNEEQLSKIKLLPDPALCLRIQLVRLCLSTPRDKDTDGSLELILVELLREACDRGLMK